MNIKQETLLILQIVHIFQAITRLLSVEVSSRAWKQRKIILENIYHQALQKVPNFKDGYVSNHALILWAKMLQTILVLLITKKFIRSKVK